MSFNYLEVAHAARIVSHDLPQTVESIELVEFPLPASALPDLNIALRLANRRSLVISLKSPWVGALLLPSGTFRSSRLQWTSAFGKAVDWNAYLRRQELQKIEASEGDRILRLVFSNGAELEIELFPARPNWALSVSGERFEWKPPKPPAARPEFARPDLSVRDFGADWMQGAYSHYLSLRQEVLLKTQQQRAAAQLQSRLSQLIKIRGQLEASRQDALKAEALKAQGERLKAALHEFPKGQRLKKLPAPYADIELDSKLSLADNASRLFARYKKLQRTRHEVELRMAGVESETKSLMSTVAKVRGFARQPDESFEKTFARLKALLENVGLPLQDGRGPERKPSKVEKKWAASGVRRFKSKEGLAIWVGRNHSENEELVIRLARGNDMWLHLKGRPGAHVIVQVPAGKSPSLETLLDAATLVAYYSNVSEREKVEVDYTFRKYVKRVPGGGEKFLVTYSQNKTLLVKIDQERLNRVMKSL